MIRVILYTEDDKKTTSSVTKPDQKTISKEAPAKKDDTWMTDDVSPHDIDKNVDTPESQQSSDSIPPQTPKSVSSWSNYFFSPIGGAYSCMVLLGIWFIYLGRQSWLGEAYLAQSNLWSNWKSSEPFKVLCMIEPEYLAASLVEDIKLAYLEDPDPVAHFLADIQAEEEALIALLQMKGVIERSWFIPVSEAWDTIYDRLDLLKHMRQAAYYWRAQQLKNSQMQLSLQ